MNNKLLEGIKFGDKEKALVLKNADDFNVGIEYEMHYRQPLDFHDLASDGYEFLKSRLNDLGVEDDLEYIYNAAIDRDEHLSAIMKDSVMLMETAYVIYNFDQLVKKNVRPDIDVDAAFGGYQDELLDDEKAPELFFRALKKEFKDRGMDWDQITKVFNDLKAESPIYEDIVLILDLYYDGELFMDDGSKSSYADYFKILSSITSSNGEDGMKGMVDSMANTEISQPADPEELPHTMGTINSDTIPYHDYDSYRDSREPIETIEDIVLDFFREHGHDYIDEISSDESGGIPTEANLADNGVDTLNIETISDDHGNQAEVITKKMNVIDAFENIDEMFGFISDHAETSNMSGMHISVSTNEYDLDDFNLMKYVALLDMDHVLDLFPSRQYVEDLTDIINEEIQTSLTGIIEDQYISNHGKLSSVELIKDLARHAKNIIDTEKHQSIKFGDYHFLDGRIELRFFGGEDYHTMETEIKHHVLRALYLLNFAYTDEYNNVFYKKLAKMVNNNVKENYGVTISTLVSALNRANKLFPEGLSKMYGRYVDTLGGYQAEDLQLFDRYMKKAFGNEWYRKLDFMRGLYE